MSIAEPTLVTSMPQSHAKNLKVYNTLSRTKTSFETVEPNKVGIYLCGPTVYKEAHIGHMVGPVIFDTIKRFLVYCGYEVDLVVNITDVDDKLIAESNRRKISMQQVATEMTMDYCANLLELGVNQITHMPKATENMQEIISFIAELIEKGSAYASEGDVYFDVIHDADYGKLTNRSAADQQGEGGATSSKKRNSGDFALWKSAKPGEPYWESPWGNGRPGWHIECSAMSRRILGKTFDIHGGGLDLTFPHHENEIAQSESCHDAPMANYWLHNGLMKADSSAGKLGGKADREKGADAAADGANAETEQATVDTKISRSKGAGGLRDLVARQTGERIRFFLIRTHYRSTIVFSEEGIEESGVALEKFYTFFDRYARINPEFETGFYLDPEMKDGIPVETRFYFDRANGDLSSEGHAFLAKISETRTNFHEKMDDDFNTGGAVSELFQLLSLLNKFADESKLENPSARKAEDLAAFNRGVETLRELSGILGLFFKKPRKSGSDDGEGQMMEDIMQLVIELRNDSRANKDYATADKIRAALTHAGIVLEDRQGETGWKKG